MKKFLSAFLKYLPAIALLMVLILIVLFLMSVSGGAVMKIFGFEYDSVWSIFKFFLATAVVGIPVDLLTNSRPKALADLNIISGFGHAVIFVILDTAGNSIVMTVADKFMKDVSATSISIIAVSFLLSVFSLVIDGKGKE